ILPVVTLATLATMNAIALPVHQMSVTGMIVALGLLVDAGIVMTDEVGQRLRGGLARLDAVRGAVRRLFAPLLASTVTTALSFAPMLLLPGPAGDFVGSIALAVVIMLGWSFVVAVTLTAAIAGWVMPAGAGGSAWRDGLRLPLLARGFRASLAWSLSHPLRAVALSLVLPVTGLLSLPTLTEQFFPGVDRDQFTIDLDLRAGTPIAATREAALRLDAALRAAPETAQVTWVLGRSAPNFYYNITGGRRNAPGHAQALVTTTSPGATEALLRRLERDAAGIVPEAQVLARGLVQGPPVDAPVELRLVGPDVERLRVLGAELRGIVAGVPGVTLARDTAGPGGPELRITVDEAGARQIGFELADLSRQLQAGLEGVTGGSLLEGVEELPVLVRLPDRLRGDLTALRDLPLVPPGGAAMAAAGGVATVPLSAVATVEVVPAAGTITRRNGERVNTVQAFVLRDLLPQEALRDAQAAMETAGFALPRGYRLEAGGDSDARADTLANLVASLGIIVTLSVATVVMTFRSFRLAAVSMAVAGLSAGLSLLSLAVFGYPFGINAII
ncbi:MAG TPA: efflux RND transporter permease subunit, partial [Paracoccaceae bacterium]|nr:efflux RND transporter permease subunit [Paracoccaceae bacterium]